MTQEQYETQAKRRIQIKAEKDAVKARIKVITQVELIAVSKDIVKFAGFVNPDPFLGLAKKTQEKLNRELFELTERLRRLDAQD
jgi:hypothetical protein